MNLSGKRLQVWHYPQMPCEPFKVPVKDEFDAYLISKTLADQHIWLEANKIIPDYTNVLEVMMWDTDKNEWVNYYNDKEEMDWEEFENEYTHLLTF